jgi:hypothetical protein
MVHLAEVMALAWPAADARSPAAARSRAGTTPPAAGGGRSAGA